MTKTFKIKSIAVFVLAVIMVLALVPVAHQIRAKADVVTYVLDATADLKSAAEGTYTNGDAIVAGTNNAFTLLAGNKTKIDGSNKSFDDGYGATQRINFGSATTFGDMISCAIQFKTKGKATVKIWWVSGGNDRQFAIYDINGQQVQKTSEASVQNSLYISEFTRLETAGTYYLTVPDGSNYLFRLEVSDDLDGAITPPARGAWASVSAPSIVSATDNGNATISVVADGFVGNDGADVIVVEMYNAENNLVATKQSYTQKSTGHALTFNAKNSGTYTFKAKLCRESEQDILGAASVNCDFKFPLGTPIIGRATSNGGGTARVVWDAIHEASSYDVYVNGTLASTVTTAYCDLVGLTVGTTVQVYVVANRAAFSDSATSTPVSLEVTEEAQIPWGTTVYGPSTSAGNDGKAIENDDGSVKVFSTNGKGKIQPASVDGLTFYYTPIEAQYNFTLRATVTVNTWTLSNGQEGFGLMACDRLGVNGDKTNFWNNSYMALASKVEYWYLGGTAYPNSSYGGVKYSMKLGLGSLARTGVTPDNLENLTAGDSDTVKRDFLSEMTALETLAGVREFEAGTYNIIGNKSGGNKTSTTFQDFSDSDFLTTFVFEIQKNNTGYFVSYFKEDGTLVKRVKYYEPDALEQLDKDYVYAGFFAARNAVATFSNISLEKILPEDDLPAEQRPITKVIPQVAVASAPVTTSADYKLLLNPNVQGSLNVYLNEQLIAENIAVTLNEETKKINRVSLDVTLEDFEENLIMVEFTADPNQDLGPYTELSTLDPVIQRIYVEYNDGADHVKTIYATPDGTPQGNGTRKYPFDLYTAVQMVIPGQTIVLAAGKYGSTVFELPSTLRIERGMDGTEENPIRMIADPELETRPELNFMGQGAGMVHGGNYWYFYGFDVTNSLINQKGFQVSGSYNVLDNIIAHHNGNTGIQISRLYGSDLFADWPHDNLVLNCTSYSNADAGHEDADGFAAKLTVGEGNVFDGCVAHHNSDDGWDLYAKVETGSIGAVVIKNSLAYANGYLENGASSGNGNGFKMGGESLSGKHQLINSVAYGNRAKGIDSNSCPDIIVISSTSYNNGGANVAFYTNNAPFTEFKADGILSFKDNTCLNENLEAENLKPKGKQVEADYRGSTNFYWNGKKSVNKNNQAVAKTWFKSLTFNGFTRNADGTLNLGDFLALTEKVPAGVGAVIGGQASNVPTLVPDETCSHDGTWSWDVDDEENHYHWHTCSCGAKLEMGEHNVVWTVTKEPTETEKGEKIGACSICGLVIAKLSVSYTPPQPELPPPADNPPVQPEQPTNKNGLKIALGVGIPCGVLGIAACVFFILKRKGIIKL